MSEDHWTENEDTLARFVLNQMDAAERAPLKEHLRTCELCKQAVRAEQQLVAGARRLGRDELKERLSERVGEQTEFPWLRVVGVAAAIVVLVSIGVYNRWFMMQQREETSPQIAQQSESIEERKGEANQNITIVPSQPQEPLGKTKSITQEARARKQESRAAKQKETKLRAPNQNEVVSVPQTAQQPMAEVESQVAAKAQMLDKTAQADHATTQELWVNGNVLPTNAAPLEETADGRKDDRATTMMKAQRNKPAAVGQQPTATLQLNGQTLILRQQPLDSLPPTQQQQGYSATRMIPTQMKQSAQTLEITLYLDTPLDDTELRSAAIQTVSDDSILVNFPHRRIAYRVPSEWGAKVRTATQQR
jgi:hypothetical protein